VPSLKAHRLIARAGAAGAVTVSIEGDIVECIELEQALAGAFGLDMCEVAPDLDERGLPLRALGRAGSAWLRRWIDGGEHTTIGVAHGRTLAEAVRALPRMRVAGVRFVSLLGGLTRNYAANPHDVMHSLAEKTGAPAFVMPVPFLANTLEDKAVLMAQKGVAQVFEAGATASLKIVGIGAVGPEAQLVRSGMVEPEEMAAIAAAGGVGEMLGRFFTASGATVDTPLTARTIAVSPRADGDDRVVALAGGAEKIGAIAAVLRSGRLSGLITDERTAAALLAAEQEKRTA
jgi:DNA-binding transcriptional regulator LsrR (DeoR family)